MLRLQYISSVSNHFKGASKMKLNIHSNVSQVNTNIVGDKKKFGIKDTGIVIDILRNRLYRHPVRTLVQEYLSNGRDANREAGKDKNPIQVTIPTEDAPTLRIRDFGPGLSKERVEDVFLYYGSSTKRDSNKQTGGFGIGAKSAWAYTDSFVIISHVDGVVTHYLADTGDSKEGELKVISEGKTKEPNGVEIQIGVDENDITSFVVAVERATYFWETRPYFTNPECLSSFYTSKAILTGKTYSVVSGINETYLDKSSCLALVIDGIMYELPESFLKNKNIEILNDFTNHGHSVCLAVANGLCEVNASREDITDSQESQNTVANLSKKVLSEIKVVLNSKMSKVDSVSSFVETYNKILEYANCSEEYYTANIVGHDFIAHDDKVSSKTFESFEMTAFTGRKTRRSSRINSEKRSDFYVENPVYFIHDDGQKSENQRKHRINFYFKQLSRMQAKTTLFVLSPNDDKDYSSFFTSLDSRSISSISVIVNRPNYSHINSGPKVPTNKNIVGINKIQCDYRNDYATNNSTDISALTTEKFIYLTKGEFESLKKNRSGSIRELKKYFDNNGLTFCYLADRYVSWVTGNKHFTSVKDFVMNISPKSYASMKSEIEVSTILLACTEHDKNRHSYHAYGDENNFCWSNVAGLLSTVSIENVKDPRVKTFAKKFFGLKKTFKKLKEDAGKETPTYLLELFFIRDASLKKLKAEFESFFKYMEKEYSLVYDASSNIQNARIAAESVIYMNAKHRG